MDFYAFLGLSMRKHRKQPELRPVEPAAVEEFVLLPNADESTEKSHVRLEVKNRSQMKFRTHEPKVQEVGSFSEPSFEDAWAVEKKVARLPPGWKWVIGLVLALFLGWMVAVFFRVPEPMGMPLFTRTSAKTSDRNEVQLEQKARQTIKSIYATVDRFYAAASLDEMLKEVRHPERVRPLMEEYYSKTPLRASEAPMAEGLNPLTIETRSDFWVVLIRNESGEQEKVVVEVAGPDDIKIDWETFVSYQPMDWDAFVKNRPADFRGDFRVYVERDDFYNYEFAKSDEYQSYKLRAKNSHEVIYGYVRRDGPLYPLMEKSLLNGEGQPVPMFLRLYLPEGLQSKSGVVIERLLAPRWLVIDEKELEK